MLIVAVSIPNVGQLADVEHSTLGTLSMVLVLAMFRYFFCAGMPHLHGVIADVLYYHVVANVPSDNDYGLDDMTEDDLKH